MKFKLKNEEIQDYNQVSSASFPKYTSQLINWANQNAQGTRPKVVGQLSELFPEFLESGEDATVENWEEWYSERYPDAVENATEKIYDQVKKLRKAIGLIDKDMVEEWVEDLLFQKTFNGLYVQQAILTRLAELKGKEYQMATPEEEARGIDGYVGKKAYSVKPDSYAAMDRLPEEIDVRMIYYTKTKNGLKVEVKD